MRVLFMEQGYDAPQIIEANYISIDRWGCLWLFVNPTSTAFLTERPVTRMEADEIMTALCEKGYIDLRSLCSFEADYDDDFE